MEISCNVISKSCLFPTDPTENFSEIETEVCKFNICTNDTEMVITIITSWTLFLQKIKT